MTSKTYYYFVPSLRQGLAAAIPERDDEGNMMVFTNRASLNVDVVVGGTGFDSSETLFKDVELYGPGDIVGFDRRVVARTDPREDVGDFEPNYFPMIEFATADFPWRYTAKQLNSTTGNLEPWIALILLISEPVLSSDEEEIEKEFEEGNRLLTNQKPFITVHSQKSLPSCNESKWWAHMQYTGDDSVLTGDGLDDEKLLNRLNSIVRNNPEQVTSHLLCPRRLRPGAKYCAFIVPTFELGRIATGLAPRSLPEGVEIDSTTIAWDNNSSEPIDLPYYYKWEFRTGMRGDFEHMVRLLEPRELIGLGKRKIDCSNPGYGLTNFTRIEDTVPDGHPDYKVTEMEGALQSIDTEYTPWGKDALDPDNDPHEFQNDLASKLLNRPKADEEIASDEAPVVGPPVYGRWHRGRKVENSMYVRPGRDHDGWLDEINLDPRHRVVCGLGTEVIIEKQEELMAAAWDQLGAIDKANEQLRRAQLGRELSCCTEKRLESLSLADYIRSTSPLHTRVKDKEERVTVDVKLDVSRIPRAVLDPAFRRISRKRGNIRKRQRSDGRLRADILHRFNEDSIHPAGPHPAPGGMVNICDITNDLIESNTFINEPPEFKSSLPEALPPGEYLYTVQVTAPEPDQSVKIEIGLSSGESSIPADTINIQQVNDNLWNISLILPEIPASSGGTGGPTSPVGGVVTIPDGDTSWIPEFVSFRLILYATDNGIPARTTVQVITGESFRGNDNWKITTTNETLAPDFPNFPLERRFYENNFTSEVINNPVVQDSIEEDDVDILNAINEMATGFLNSDQPPPDKPSINLIQLEHRLKEALDPEIAIPKRVLKRINMQDVVRLGDSLDRIMAAPDFPQPMYEALRDISQDLLLPGLEKVPQNTISLLETNHRFIESYMVGLNHEFSRELLWREYPTDQRGSYFRQFWDVADLVPSPSELETLLNEYLSKYGVDNVTDLDLEEKVKVLNRYRKRVGVYEDYDEVERDSLVKELLEEEVLEERYKDIKKLHEWRENQLGTNKHRTGKDLVLILRGDLLKRYPNTVIYAVKAVKQDAESENIHPNMTEFTGSDMPGEIKYPIFKGTLPPDVFFLGFDIDEEEAWGCEGPGWYFVLEERISESRFGLDVPSEAEISWDNLAWHHFGLADKYESYVGINQCHLPDTFINDGWNNTTSSGFISSKVVQKPVRIFIHAKQMLPKNNCT